MGKTTWGKCGKWKYDIPKSSKSIKDRCKCNKGDRSLLKCKTILDEDRQKTFSHF